MRMREQGQVEMYEECLSLIDSLNLPFRLLENDASRDEKVGAAAAFSAACCNRALMQVLGSIGVAHLPKREVWVKHLARLGEFMTEQAKEIKESMR